jgi:hypothetical protein
VSLHLFFHSSKQPSGPNPIALPSFLPGKTELAKQTAKYMHKDAKKVRTRIDTCFPTMKGALLLVLAPESQAL